MSASYARAPQGTDLPWAKLNDEIVRRVRRARDRRKKLIAMIDARYSAAALAKRYQVSQSAMEKVLAFQSWRHVR